MKQLFMTLVALGMAAASFFLVSNELSQGYAIVGRRHAETVTRTDSPIAFFLIVGGTSLFGMAMLIAACLFATAKGQVRKALLDCANRNVFYVRPSIRRLFVALVVFLIVVFAAIRIRG